MWESYSHSIIFDNVYICKRFLIKVLGSDSLKSLKAEKRSWIFTAFKIGEKSSVQGLNFSTLSPNWHIPKLAHPLTGTFRNWHLSQFFCAIEKLSSPRRKKLKFFDWKLSFVKICPLYVRSKFSWKKWIVPYTCVPYTCAVLYKNW